MAVPADSVRIVAQFPAALAGAGFQITRDAGTRTVAASETLRSGVLPGSGLLSVDVPRAGLPADNGVAFIQVMAALPIPGTKTALQSIGSLGLTDHTLAEMSVIAITPPVPTVVPTYTLDEAMALTGGGGTAGEQPPTQAELDQMNAEAEARQAAGPDQVDPGIAFTGSRSDGSAVAPQDPFSTGSPEPDSVDPATEGAAAGGDSPEDSLTGPVSPEFQGQNGPDIALSTLPVRTTSATVDQVTDSEDIYGVLTFRSWSSQGYGMWATFKMSATAETVTQNGFRTEGGAFAVNGTTSMSKQASTSSTTTDTWPKRSDCWRHEGTGQFPMAQGDGPDCGNLFFGFIGAMGHDTWRWEQHLASYCDGHWFCTHTVYETVRNHHYVGGTINGEFLGMNNYGKKPASIRAGSYGNWTSILPGSQRSSDFNQSFTRSRGATVQIKASYGSAFGSAVFESSTSQRNESLTTMSYEFRDPAYVGDGSQFLARFWYYDYDGSQKFDHFSCEFEPGWSSQKNSCWVYGS